MHDSLTIKADRANLLLAKVFSNKYNSPVRANNISIGDRDAQGALNFTVIVDSPNGIVSLNQKETETAIADWLADKFDANTLVKISAYDNGDWTEDATAITFNHIKIDCLSHETILAVEEDLKRASFTKASAQRMLDTPKV